jgi:hypothetical protein
MKEIKFCDIKKMDHNDDLPFKYVLVDLLYKKLIDVNFVLSCYTDAIDKERHLNAMRFNDDISEETKKSYIGMYQPVKSVWGMSTRRAQIAIATAQGIKKEDIKLKTSEGVEKQVNVEYTLHQWLENFRDYLRSSMSYCNSEDLEHYIGQQEIMLMSEAAKNAINK